MIRTEEYRDQILELYKTYGNGGRVAKELGITNYRVYKCLRENGIEPKSVGGKEKASVEDMIQLYEGGLSLNQVASRLHMSNSSVLERLQKHGYKLRTRREALELCGHVKASIAKERGIVAMYKAGMSTVDIANRIGLKCKDGILRVLKKHNIKLREARGDNHPNWKGGRLALNKLIRNSAEYISFRDQIFQERDYTCEITGQRGGKLHMHHIIPMSQLIDEFVNKYGQDIGKPDKRDVFFDALRSFSPFWDKTNVVILTEEKHKELHSSVLLSRGV